MTTYDPRKIRPKDGWVVVLADERKEKSAGGIILTDELTAVERVEEGAALLIRVGPGEKNHRLGLEAGLRVVYRGFLKYAHPIENDEKWPSGKGKHYFIMNSDDILGILAPGVEVGVFSGRPEVPERQ